MEVDSQQKTENSKAANTENVDTNSHPTLTIGIPVLNEEEHIERVVSGFLSSSYPNIIEVLIADGGSTDNTRRVVESLSEKDGRVKLIENPERFQSFALNKMIDLAKGELFLRADGHCFYADDYIEKNVEVFQKTGAKNVGGAQRYMASNWVQAGIALAVKSFLGNGGAKYMNESYEGYGDTVFLGCFKTTDLREIGGFNTENVTNQDSELNLRFIDKFGESIFISPEIKSWYFPRDSFSKLFKQYFRYGRGRFLTKVLHPKSSPIRGLMPFFFLLFLVVYLLVDILLNVRLYSLETFSLLATIVGIESCRVLISYKELFKDEIWQGESKKPNYLITVISSSISIVIMQIGHFSGFMYQFLKSIFNGSKEW